MTPPSRLVSLLLCASLFWGNPSRGWGAEAHCLAPVSIMPSEENFDAWLKIKLCLFLRALEEHGDAMDRPVCDMALETFQAGGPFQWLGEDHVGTVALYRFKVRTARIALSYDRAARKARVIRISGLRGDYPGLQWLGSLISAEHRLLEAERGLAQGRDVSRLDLWSAQAQVHVLRTMVRYPSWLTFLATVGVGATIDALYGTDHGLVLGVFVGGLSISDQLDSYIGLDRSELDRTKKEQVQRLQSLEQDREKLEADILRIENILRTELGSGYKDREAQQEKWAKHQRLLQRLRSQPRAWGVASDVLKRGRKWEEVKLLYDQWAMLEKDLRALYQHIFLVKEKLFLAEVKLEIKDIHEELVGLNERRNILKDHIAILDPQLRRLESVQVEQIDEQIDLRNHAVRANLFIAQRDPAWLALVHPATVAKYYAFQKERQSFGKDLLRWLDHYQTQASPIGVDRAFDIEPDFKKVWQPFLEACQRKGIALRAARGDAWHLSWDRQPKMSFTLRVVPSPELRSLGVRDVSKDEMLLSTAAFTSPHLAIETLLQILDTYVLKQEDPAEALVERIVQSLARIMLLKDLEQQAITSVLDRANVNGIDTLGFADLIDHHRRHGADAALLEKIRAYIRQAPGIYPIESYLLEDQLQVDAAL